MLMSRFFGESISALLVRLMITMGEGPEWVAEIGEGNKEAQNFDYK